MQIVVTSVHVRVEDELSHSEEPISAGVAIESVTIQNEQVYNNLIITHEVSLADMLYRSTNVSMSTMYQHIGTVLGTRNCWATSQKQLPL